MSAYVAFLLVHTMTAQANSWQSIIRMSIAAPDRTCVNTDGPSPLGHAAVQTPAITSPAPIICDKSVHPFNADAGRDKTCEQELACCNLVTMALILIKPCVSKCYSTKQTAYVRHISRIVSQAGRRTSAGVRRFPSIR